MPGGLLTSYASGGARRPDSFSGMNPAFSDALGNMFAGAPANVQRSLQITSGYRSTARQQQLYDAAVAKYGSPQTARSWVAPPGRSYHNKGYAADLGYLDADAKSWVHQNAAAYGLSFPLANEPWHVELATARKGLLDPTPEPMDRPKAVVEGPVNQERAARSRMPGQRPAAQETGLGLPDVPAAPAPDSGFGKFAGKAVGLVSPALGGLLGLATGNGAFRNRDIGQSIGGLLGTLAAGPIGGLLGGYIGNRIGDATYGTPSRDAQAAMNAGWDGFSGMTSAQVSAAQRARLGGSGSGSPSRAATAAMNAGWDGFSGMTPGQAASARSAGSRGGGGGTFSSGASGPDGGKVK